MLFATYRSAQSDKPGRGIPVSPSRKSQCPTRMRAGKTMAYRRSIAPIAYGLLVTLALSVHVPEAFGQQSARSGISEPTGTSEPTKLASASSSRARSRQTRPRRRHRRTRRLRRQATFSLPQVTPYGIPRLHAKAALVVDATSNKILFQKNPEQLYPIASLTKLMTALVYFQTNPQFDSVVEIAPEDVRHSSRSHIRPREEITVRDLLHASLMASDNVATKALVRSCGLPREEFVRRMNALADSLSLTGTHFVEPTGLDEQNVATAQAIATLLRIAASNPVAGSIAGFRPFGLNAALVFASLFPALSLLPAPVAADEPPPIAGAFVFPVGDELDFKKPAPGEPNGFHVTDPYLKVRKGRKHGRQRVHYGVDLSGSAGGLTVRAIAAGVVDVSDANALIKVRRPQRGKLPAVV